MTGFASRLSFARVLYSIQCGNAHPGCTIALSEAFLACVKGLCVQRSRPFASARGLVSEGSLPIARKEPAWIRHEKPHLHSHPALVRSPDQVCRHHAHTPSYPSGIDTLDSHFQQVSRSSAIVSALERQRVLCVVPCRVMSRGLRHSSFACGTAGSRSAPQGAGRTSCTPRRSFARIGRSSRVSAGHPSSLSGWCPPNGVA